MTILDIERHLNNRPSTYLDSDAGEEQVLTPNVSIRGQNAHAVEEVDDNDDDGVTALHKPLNEAKRYVRSRWKHEYLHCLSERRRDKRKTVLVPDVDEIVLIAGDDKNRGYWGVQWKFN